MYFKFTNISVKTEGLNVLKEDKASSSLDNSHCSLFNRVNSTVSCISGDVTMDLDQHRLIFYPFRVDILLTGLLTY